MQYGVRWEVLAAINEIETDYGRNLNISSAGALGWMQFMPPTWEAYGVDANGDGVKDPFNPVDAIFAAARYLRAAGADTDIRRAVFAYNHADWYVDSVLMRAQVIGGLPADLVGSLTGLTQGRFPIHAKSTYAGQLTKKGNKVPPGQRRDGRGARRRPPRHQDLLPRQGARDRGQRRPRRQNRQDQAPGQLRDAPGRLRQHLHLRPPRRGLPHLPGAEGPHNAPRQGRRRARARRPARPRRVEHGPAGTPAHRRRARRPRARARRPPPRPPRSACSPTRRAPRPAPQAATSSSPRPATRRPRPLRSASTPATSTRRRSRRARASSAARSSAASAPRRRRPAPTCCSRSAPPAPAPRASIRSRSSTAGSCSSPRRSTAPRARTRSSAPTRRTRRSASSSCSARSSS